MTNLTKAESSALLAYSLQNPAVDGLPDEASPRVLVVDDDMLFREALKSELNDWGFRVTDFGDGLRALEFLDHNPSVDVILLDWRMPVMSGIELLQQLKRRRVNAPVVFLTGLPSEAYEENALADGAVDFVDKTRSISIIVRRLRLAIHSSRAAGYHADLDEVVFGRLRLRVKVCATYWNERPVDLTVTEFRIVRHLVKRAGDNVSYREIYDCVHGAGFIAGYGEDGYRTNVRSLIKRIRQKFRACDNRFCEIENLQSFGYRWRSDADAGT